MFNGSSCYGQSGANDLGSAAANDLGWSALAVTPRWFLPVLVWHPRSGK